MLWEKPRNLRNFFLRNNIIFHNSHLFLPATYTLRVLIDVDVPLLINFLIFFAHPPPPLLILNPLFIIFSNLLKPKLGHPRKRLGFLAVSLTRITRSIHLIKEKCISTLHQKWIVHLKSKSMMMIMMENSFLGPLAVVMVQKKKMMKRLKTINFSVDFMFTETVIRLWFLHS